MTEGRRRLIRELVFTGIAAPFTMLLSPYISRAAMYLGRAISSRILRAYPPQEGGWFAGLGTFLIVDFVLMWSAIWMVLFVVVKLVNGEINRKKREA
jgi:hypothetical protein